MTEWRRLPGSLLLAALLTAGSIAPCLAEPYIAARAHARCSSCHVNMTGGGERNSQGRVYAMGTLSRSPFDPSEQLPLLTGEVTSFMTAGADLRFASLTVHPPRREGSTSNEFRTEEANLYLTVKLWREKMLLHVDEKVAPGGATSREAFLLYRGLPGDGWVKAGRFFPPYGTRLYDDFAFIRNATGYSFQTSDEGLEIGFEPGQYSLVTSVTNGAGGGAENDASKLVSLYFSRLMGGYRLGTSWSNNVTGGTRTSIGAIFGSAAWRNLVVLAEGDLRADSGEGLRPGQSGEITKKQWIAHLEGYWEVTRGFTLRLSHEYLDPDRDVSTDARTRSGVGFAWFPVGNLEIDARALYLDGPRQSAGQNGWSLQAAAHLFF